MFILNQNVLYETLKIEADIHTHSISSGHYSRDTITCMLKQARSNGLALLGISEHGPGIPESCSVSYFRSLKNAPRNRLGIQVLYGAELNILDKVTAPSGSRYPRNQTSGLDLEDEVMSGLDYCIAGMHPPCFAPAGSSDHTAAFLRAIENPYVRFLSHPEDPKYPSDYEQVILAARRHRVILEVNNSSLSPSGYRGEPEQVRRNLSEILELCRHYELPVLLSSDSHGHSMVGHFGHSLKLLRELRFPPELILNRRACDLTAWLREG